MRKYLQFLIISFLISQYIGVALAQKPRKLDLYLLVGQSNMAGRGAVETEDRTPHPRIWMLNKQEEWVPATEPMHFDKPTVVGVGPGFAFGRKIAEAFPRRNIGLIPCAAGGSAIDSWVQGGYHDQTKTYPYDETLVRARAALKNGRLKGIIWHQGESDSSPEKAEEYAAKLADLIQLLRQELNAPDVPVVVGTLGDFYVAKSPAAAVVNRALEALPQQVDNTACVSSGGLIHKGDNTHFDSPSARELGRRYAEAMLKLVK
ncbi:sialate O-acetylesterase [Telluribacter sp. SYSU D00476]|uniref:sialate O-acetylesterase n=1 Tax=Telluribacter sp. SYSU D00476 TaxID=2811430 RepID=UPI001FF1C8E6|nr:sialate O-acetylesterase [Telluribacter sp. SYSU D00476]